MIRELLLTLLFTLCHGETEFEKEFRFDYKFSKNADGWLKLHQVPGTWQEARHRCRAEGGVLASPLTNQLQSAILDYVAQVRGTAPYTFYTGVHATFSKGDFASVDGVPLLKMSITWAVGEPNNAGNSENCLVMTTQSNGTMADVRCSDPFPYVCYKKNTMLTKNRACGTYDTEYRFDSRTGNCYKFHRRGLTWPNAYMTCMAEGGHLAVINSEEESTALMELFVKYPDNVIFSEHTDYASLGFSDPNDGGSWITIHGETLEEAGFERWQSGEPNNASQPVGELCGVMYRGNGNFYDAPCYWSLAFICEKKPESLENED